MADAMQQYLHAEHLVHGGGFRPAKVTISEVIPPNTVKSADGKIIDKTIVRFDGKSRALILCKTNEGIIRTLTGHGPDGWVGQEITLEARVVNAFGARVLAVRVIPRPGQLLRRGLLQRLGDPVPAGIDVAL